MQSTAEFDEISVKTTDGLTLYVRRYHPELLGQGQNVPVVCLPGLTRNSRDFHQLATLISKDLNKPRTVYTVDSRGRGNSDWDDDKSHYNLFVEASDVISVCEQLKLERAIFIGTSRGGLVLHLLITMKPDLIAASILNDIGPEVGLDGLRHIQAYLSSNYAPCSFDEAAKHLAAIHSKGFPGLIDTDWIEMAYAIYAEKNGTFGADFDSAISDSLKALDLSKPGPTLWHQFEALASKSLLVIRGETSQLLTLKTLEEMADRAPHIKTITAPAQGHAPLLHQSSVFPHISEFLNNQV